MSQPALDERVAEVRAQVAEAARASGRPPEAVRIMAVTKGHPASAVDALLALGFTLFGENRVQEARQKYAGRGEIGSGISLHLIGHLQTNKVKLALASFQVIQTLDSERLAKALNDRADGPVRVMVEVNMGREPQKSGVWPEAVQPFLEALAQWPALSVIGLMAMLPEHPVDRPLEAYMEDARRLWDSSRRSCWPWAPLDELSMGMSGDYPLAIRQGSTMVRLGTALLGHRPTAPARE
jgi:pyridoxal phosphate enzyme (YggS family)